MIEPFLWFIIPVNESMVHQEYGVVGWTLHWGHGAVHEDMQGVVHGALAWHCHTCLWIGKTYRTEEKWKTEGRWGEDVERHERKDNKKLRDICDTVLKRNNFTYMWRYNSSIGWMYSHLVFQVLFLTSLRCFWYIWDGWCLACWQARDLLSLRPAEGPRLWKQSFKVELALFETWSLWKMLQGNYELDTNVDKNIRLKQQDIDKVKHILWT